MTYFNWMPGEPSYDKSKEDHIVMRKSGAGRWNDEEDTTGYTFFKKQNGVVCQDVTKGNGKSNIKNYFVQYSGLYTGHRVRGGGHNPQPCFPQVF